MPRDVWHFMHQRPAFFIEELGQKELSKKLQLAHSRFLLHVDEEQPVIESIWAKYKKNTALMKHIHFSNNFYSPAKKKIVDYLYRKQFDDPDNLKLFIKQKLRSPCQLLDFFNDRKLYGKTFYLFFELLHTLHYKKHFFVEHVAFVHAFDNPKELFVLNNPFYAKLLKTIRNKLSDIPSQAHRLFMTCCFMDLEEQRKERLILIIDVDEKQQDILMVGFDILELDPSHFTVFLNKLASEYKQYNHEPELDLLQADGNSVFKIWKKRSYCWFDLRDQFTQSIDRSLCSYECYCNTNINSEDSLYGLVLLVKLHKHINIWFKENRYVSRQINTVWTLYNWLLKEFKEKVLLFFRGLF